MSIRISDIGDRLPPWFHFGSPIIDTPCSLILLMTASTFSVTNPISNVFEADVSGMSSAVMSLALSRVLSANIVDPVSNSNTCRVQHESAVLKYPAKNE